MDSEADTYFEDLMNKTKSKDAVVRKKALKEFCPCNVRKDIDLIWERIMEMVDDDSPTVRYQVVHNLCDGAPKHMEDKIVTQLETMWNDPDLKVRKAVRRVLNSYRRTGDWNVM
eukprot:TRINITY_DN11134_c0_g1_i1.p1 TRINITY_DN11134_c0_g1~~TRINITY_DN11134_c0_g1_i1.p1  ORF type:complete len:114 (+),score=24.21 TRINITY_DN11134_c0_g1_i1:122-463(+)